MHHRETRLSLVLELNLLSNIRNKEREEKHPLDFGTKNKMQWRETRLSLVLELNHWSDVKKGLADTHPLDFGTKHKLHRTETQPTVIGAWIKYPLHQHLLWQFKSWGQLTHTRTGFIFRRIKSLFHHSNWQHIFLISFNGTSKRGVMHYKYFI